MDQDLHLLVDGLPLPLLGALVGAYDQEMQMDLSQEGHKLMI
jgi:hypothetical protein